MTRRFFVFSEKYLVNGTIFGYSKSNLPGKSNFGYKDGCNFLNKVPETCLSCFTCTYRHLGINN